MQFNKHGNGKGHDDLYVLPENELEITALVDYANNKGRTLKWIKSDVEGQAWYGKTFAVFPFGEHLRPEIEALEAI